MRILVALLLASAAVTLVPTAAACHPNPLVASASDPGNGSLGGYYVVPEVHDCPHAVCVEVWKESNGRAGLQGWNDPDPDTLVYATCGIP